MQLKRSMFTIICTLAVIILCFANTTYAWESLEQSAVNITTGEATVDDPDDPDKPDDTDKPGKPDAPQEPDNSEDSEKPEDSKKPVHSDKPSKKPGNSTTQNGKADADTGDTSGFLFYLSLMLLSFLLIIIIGVTMIVLTINALENRRS